MVKAGRNFLIWIQAGFYFDGGESLYSKWILSTKELFYDMSKHK